MFRFWRALLHSHRSRVSQVRCAVNPLKESVRSNLYEVDKFPREASILRSLRHPVYCGMCTLCVVGVDMCKNHSTKAFKPLLEELKVGREAWACTLEECTRSAEQLCAAIQADGDAKTQAITANIAAEVAALQQQVRFVAAARSTDLGNIVQKRREREELVARAIASPDLGVAGSSSAAVVARALDRANAPIPPASAAEFHAAAAPAVGRVLVSVAVVDP